jgi:cell pole-organizing protein PopZ
MSSPQHEPTMEEILASIRKIISEDNPEAAAAAAAPAPAATPAPAPAPAPVAAAPVAKQVVEEDDAEVLELTQEMAAPPPPPRPEPAPAPAPPPVVEAKPDEIVFEPAPQRAAADSGDSGIFSDRTRQAMADTFDSIPDEPSEAPRYQPQPSMASGAGSSVESVFERAVRESFEPVLQQYLADNSQVVIERMKPLIREWMDEKFPALLENAVRGEVERIVKARTKR